MQRWRQAVVKIDHAGTGLHVAQREEQVDHDAGLDFEQIGERRFGRDLLHGLEPLADGRGQPVLVSLRIIDHLAKHVRLAVVDLPARQVVDQLEHRAVVARGVARFAQQRADRLDRGGGVDRLALAVRAIGDPAHQRNVERNDRALDKDDRGAARPQRMANAELVEHIGIGAGDVGDCVVAQHQALEHRLMDRAADLLFVRAYRLEAGVHDRRHNDVLINLVEIGDPAGRIGLGAERHEHEAERRQLVDSVHEIVLCPPLQAAPIIDYSVWIKLGQNRSS